MSLLRMTERKLAANRANARKSTGPRTPEGKAVSSQNNAIHYLYARKYTIPPEWDAECAARASALTGHFTDPIERELRQKWTYVELWIRRLDGLEANLCRREIQNAHGDVRRGTAAWVHHNPLFRAWLKRFCQLTSHAARLFRSIKAYCRNRHTIQLPPPPKTMAAGANSSPGAGRTHISLIPNGHEFYPQPSNPLLTSFQQPFGVASL